MCYRQGVRRDVSLQCTDCPDMPPLCRRHFDDYHGLVPGTSAVSMRGYEHLTGAAANTLDACIDGVTLAQTFGVLDNERNGVNSSYSEEAPTDLTSEGTSGNIVELDSTEHKELTSPIDLSPSLKR